MKMSWIEYEYLQERLTYKMKNNPYKRTGCTNYETGYNEGILAAKSILSSYFHNKNIEEEHKPLNKVDKN